MICRLIGGHSKLLEELQRASSSAAFLVIVPETHEAVHVRLMRLANPRNFGTVDRLDHQLGILGRLRHPGEARLFAKGLYGTFPDVVNEHNESAVLGPLLQAPSSVTHAVTGLRSEAALHVIRPVVLAYVHDSAYRTGTSPRMLLPLPTRAGRACPTWSSHWVPIARTSPKDGPVPFPPGRLQQCWFLRP